MAATTGVPTFGVRAAVHDYSGVVVLRDVDFELHGGEIHALLGENGSGKSTLIKVLTGAVRPTAGTLYLDGDPVAFATPQQAQAAGVAVVHQNYNLFPDLTVEKTLLASAASTPRRLTGLGAVDHRAWRQRVEQLLDRLGVDLDPRSPVGALGPAERKFVEIARAMATEPRFLILDEPTASLEPSAADRVLALMRTLRTHGVGLAFVSHRLDEVAATADRVTVLRDGARVAERASTGLTTAEMARLMVGDRPQESLRPEVPTVRPDVLLRLREVRCVDEGDSFDLDVHAGEILAVTGLVGSGAARFVSMVGGDVPLHGRAEMDGREVRLRTARDAQAQGIGFIPEDRKARGLVLEHSCAVNISLASLGQVATTGRVSRRRLLRRAEEFRTRLDIRMPSLTAPASALSGGNQQKVLVAKWLASGVRLIAVEEPTQGVDIGGRAQIHDLLHEFTAGGGAVVLFSTDVREVLGLADRVAVFRHGCLSRVHPVGDLDQARLTALTAGEEQDPGPRAVDAAVPHPATAASAPTPSSRPTVRMESSR
ncbi:sugar ABC transporter ATP-binding protein [Geodermatophilus sabuli]|uniref:Ribose transport system ATP-binding protein/rhamnose transport system ATP-binding protein n=1 Tax=Geodermatophilus sabuli TaxID=1564158 RepID=A0A285EBP2_9ACTN|nr:sugar ABC transporter ATP-binding protein [Geodermatophilus sabuli]MBB3085299.1 ABC-type sugar transport system ATPase subunit [Geodermatophilus sabuli]SNX96273.1 ribose transport system ATP-binding protein/rhamnose transport system ATP-binding protein [Geodermatophilus sabuli]